MITPEPHSNQAHIDAIPEAKSKAKPELTAPAPETLLQLRQLRKCFAKENGEQLVALDDLDLCIERNHHLISLIGPDGSGKSTLLQIMAGLLLPDGGTYELNLASAQGPDLGSNGPSQELRIASSDIGYMSQTLGLYEDISVWENLKLFSQLRDLDTSSLIDPNQAPSAAAQPNVPSETQMPHGASQQSWWSKLWPFTTKRTTALSANAALDTYLTELLTKVGLIKFKDYKAGSLSGGMKQKLALTCALSAKPKLLLLDEPTVGVDPISRRELWSIIYDYLDNYHGYCIFSSLYLEEAERSSLTIFIKEGRIIYQGDAATLKQQVKSQCFALHPAAHLSYQKLARALMINLPHSKLIRDICPRMGRIDLLTAPEVTLSALNAELQELFTLCGYELSASDYQVQARDPILEDAYINLTGATASAGGGSGASADSSSGLSIDSSNDFSPDHVLPPDASDTLASENGKHVVIDVQGIRKQFGDFTAVHDSNFKVYQGEIFGLLGPNGAGKTTTFRMICALLNPSAGKILIQGLTLANAKSSVRATIGYVAQKFCLYRKLTLRQNLSYFGKSYGLSGQLLQERMDQMCQIFGLTPFLDESAASLPFGVQRSLSMACALIHRPSILFLDEATSGADPTSRRVFWQMISKLSAQGTTIIVTTHFMEEAEYCDRFLIQDQGKILILGTPDEICSPHNTALSSNQKERISIEEAFIACVESQRAANTTHGAARGTDAVQGIASTKASDKSTLYSTPSQANSEEDHHGN